MAAAFGRNLGTNGSDGTSTVVITTVATASVGERVSVQVVWLGSGTTVSSCADSAGNTYAIDVQANDGLGVAICSANVTTQLASSGTITVTFSNSSAGWVNVHACALTGIATSSAVDTTNTLADDDENMATTATNSSTADAIIVGLFGMRDGTDYAWTAGGSATKISETKFFNINTASQYRVITATGNNNLSGSWSGTSNLDGIGAHVIYKAAGGGTSRTVTAVVASSTASAVAPPKPRPTAPFSEINVRM